MYTKNEAELIGDFIRSCLPTKVNPRLTKTDFIEAMLAELDERITPFLRGCPFCGAGALFFEDGKRWFAGCKRDVSCTARTLSRDDKQTVANCWNQRRV